MTSLWQDGLTITLDPGGANTSLKPEFVAMPMLTDVVTEEARQGVLVLDAPDGKFITTSPIIDEFDRIRVAHTAEDGSVYLHDFEVDKLIPRQSRRGGTKLEIQLLGTERNLQGIQYIKPHFNENPNFVVRDILSYYQGEKGTDQPNVTDFEGTDNELPTWVINNWEYGLNEDSVWDRIKESIDNLAKSANDGGVFDFFEFRLDSDVGDPNLLHFKAFVSGSKPASPITIEQATDINIGETEAGIESKKGTIVIHWGAVGEGSLPTSFSRFRGERESFALHPIWDSTAPYLIDHRVNLDGVHYKSLTDNNIGNNPTSTDPDWVIITEGTEFGNTDATTPITYSFWTRQKSAIFKNAGANHADLGTDEDEPFGESCWDGNLVVWDDGDEAPSFQSWVHLRGLTSAAIDTDYLYGGVTAGQYRGLRILVDDNLGTIGVPWTQNGGLDANGRQFADAMVQHNGGNETGGTEWQNWDVLYKADSTDEDGMACAVRQEGRVYKFTNAGGWANEAGTPFANHCFHPYDSLTDDGGIESDSTGDTDLTANTQSAIKVVYSTGGVPPVLATNFADKKDYYSAGCWINIAWPFPENSKRGIGENVGDIYGGGLSGTSIKEPATVDTQNMHFSANGTRGFNHGLDSADYGQLDSIDFFLKHRIELDFPALFTVPRGDLKWRCFMFDTSDNVVYQDFTLPHNGVYEAVKLPLTGFQTYRGRRPIEGGFEAMVPPKKLSAVNQFFWRNTKLMSLQWQEPYDGDGRYVPWLTNENNSAFAIPIVGRMINTAHLDGLRFSKPLLAVTDPITDRVITQQGKETPTIINYRQLFGDAKAELEKQKFRRRQYDVVTSGSYNIKPGESFFLKNPNTIPTSDDSGTLNTMKLVAKRLEYSITRPRSGSGGFVRTIQGVRRLET